MDANQRVEYVNYISVIEVKFARDHLSNSPITRLIIDLF